MMEAFSAYIKTITALTVFSAFLELLLPDGKLRRYGRLLMGVVILTAVLGPFLELFGAAGEPFSAEDGLYLEGE